MKYWFMSKDSIVFSAAMPVTVYIDILLDKIGEKKLGMVVMRLNKKNAKTS